MPKNFLYVNVNFVWNQCANLKICTYVEWPVSLLFSFSVNVKRQCTHTSDTHSNARAHRQRKRDKKKHNKLIENQSFKIHAVYKQLSNYLRWNTDMPIVSHMSRVANICSFCMRECGFCCVKNTVLPWWIERDGQKKEKYIAADC